MARRVIALLTDFGLTDWFVGSMKSVILSRIPDCTIVDFCHGIEPGNIAQAAWLLERTFQDFAPETVFCCVVDPGVGTRRRALAVSAGGCFFVAPDNGLLTGVRRRVSGGQCRGITNPAWMQPVVSRTFHGRDVFAPAAAEVVRRQSIEDAGEAVADPIVIEMPDMVLQPDGSIEGVIVCFDRFGNAVTTVERATAERRAQTSACRIEIGRSTIERVSVTYGDVAPGDLVAYWGSLDTLEIAIRDGNARELLPLQLGDSVRLRG